MQFSNIAKSLRSENKHLQSLLAQLIGTQVLKQIEQDSAKKQRHIEVAALQQACAKYKLCARVAIPLSAASTSKQAVPTCYAVVCCQKTIADSLRQLRQAMEAHFNSHLTDKEREIERLTAALANKDRKADKKRTK